MAIKEGRCPNCGSIINLDANGQKGHCLFCDAVFDSKTAFEIAADPTGYEFPNEPQPKYEGPDLQPKTGSQAGRAVGTQSAQAAKKKRPAPQKAYVHKEPIKLPDTKLSPQMRRKVIIVTLAVIILIAAISVPLIITRDGNRSQLLEAMPEIAPFSIDADSDVVLRRLNNSFLLIVADELISRDDMILLFKNFSEKRADIHNYDPDDFSRVYGKVTVRLITPEGGYQITNPQSMAELNDKSAITEIKQ